jgi:iron complex outermembrane recepter protein
MLNGMTLRLCLVAIACSTSIAGYAFGDDAKEINQPAGDLAADSEPYRLAQASQTTRANAPAQTPDQGAEFAEIIVTATKRAENLQDIPLPVSVETSAQLVEAGYTNLLDYAANVPSLNVGSMGTPGQTQVSIRGISSTSAVSAIGVYLDDVAMGSSNGWALGSTTLLDMMPYELDRIEVLRGPQGTLYGEGAMGGIIKYVLKTPSTTKLEANVGADVSSIDGARDPGYTVRTRVNIPVISGVLGVSVGGFDKVTPGFMYNQYTGQRDTNRDQEYGGRIAVLWTPTSNVSIKLTGLTQEIQADDSYDAQFAGFTKISTPGGPLEVVPTHPLPDLTKNVAFLAPFDQHLNFVSSTVDWNPGPFDVASSTSFSSQRSHRILDETPGIGAALQSFGATGPGLATFNQYFGLNKFDQEIRLNSTQGNTFDWLGGVFYTKEQSFNNQYFEAFNYSYQRIAPYPQQLYYAAIPSTLSEYAAFGNVKWRVTDAFDLTAGARYAHSEQSFNDYVYPTGVFGLPGYSHAAFNEDVTTWLGTAEYHFDKDTMIYGRAASGYRPGGLQAVAGAQTYKSDSLINYELGVKSTFLDGKMRINLAAFRIDWKDIQLNAITPANINYIANGGKAVSQGFEVESLYSPIHGLTLGINAAYTNAHLTSVIANADYLLTGYQLPFVPKETVSFTADYDWALTGRWNARVGGAYRYTAKQYLATVESASSTASSPTVQVPGYSVFDLHASVRDEHLTFSLYGHNIANSRALTGANFNQTTDGVTGAQQVSITNLQPRTIALGVDYAF